MIGIQPLLDILSDHFWFNMKPSGRKASNASELGLPLSESPADGSDRSRSNSIARDHQLSFHDVRELRAYVLFLFKQIVTGSKEVGSQLIIDDEDMRRLLTYLNSIMNDSDQLIDFVPLVVAILTEQPTAVTDSFVSLGMTRPSLFIKTILINNFLFPSTFLIDGIKSVLPMITNSEEVVKVYCLKTVRNESSACFVPKTQ